MIVPISERFLTAVGSQLYQTCPYYHTNAYLRSLYLLGSTPPGRADLAKTLAGLPEITKVSGSTITLYPEADPKLFTALRKIVQQQLLLYRNGKTTCISPNCFRSGQATIIERDDPLWCVAATYNVNDYTKIVISPSAKHVANTREDKLLVSPYQFSWRQHSRCVNDCIAAIQCFLDEVRNTLTGILYHNERLELNQLPQLEEIDYDHLTFSNLGVSDQSIYQSGITRVLSGVKNIYAKGDAGGRKVYRHKRSANQEVANDRFRIQISFTIHKRADQLIVRFYYDLGHKPYFIIPCSHGKHQEMTTEQTKEYREAFVHSCATALQAYFTAIRDQAALNFVAPDYWQPWPHQLTSPRTSSADGDLDGTDSQAEYENVFNDAIPSADQAQA